MAPKQGATGPKPGDGIRSMDTTSLFRITNFELYVKPNKFIMAFGLVAATACFGYLYYWNHSQRTNPNSPTYVAVNEDDTLTIRKRSSRWN
ncbi:protein of unknown function (DUF4500) [Tyrophagus putrescentiae]|nr:protein of unknown function (DUF4500) [Tyrophagus putrescentiae]